MAENIHKDTSLLTVKDAADYLGISESALRKRIHLGQVGGLIRLGERLYFDRPKLEKFIDELTIDTNNQQYQLKEVLR
jgi:excisionase family DNA binding protein